MRTRIGTKQQLSHDVARSRRSWKHVIMAGMLVGGLISVLLATIAVQSPSAHAAVAAKHGSSPSLHLIWSDNFNGNTLDPSKWTADNEPSPRNNEQEYYTPSDVSVANGSLAIKTEKRSMGGLPYTSGFVHTWQKFSFTYGRVDVRAKVAPFSGAWPAAWLLGDGCGPSAGDPCNWPNAGSAENDFMEMFGKTTTNSVTLHYADPTTGATSSMGCGNVGPTNVDYSQSFHVFSTETSPGKTDWYIDNQLVCEKTYTPTLFNTPAYLILNTAICPSWCGVPIGDAQLPQSAYYDYVHVYSSAANGYKDVAAINAGSTDNVSGFAPDAHFSGTNSQAVTTYNSIDISGVKDPADVGMYQSNRVGPSFMYTFPNLKPDHTYRLRLHFAETYWTAAHQRQFNVLVSDGHHSRHVLTNFDVFAAAGGANKAVVRDFTVHTTSTGQIDVQFASGASDQPMVSGLELLNE
ncbi:hypothetical protein KDH_10540 [Dictyobacter sp. S3.2.2.5]|uniref:GH16 domain-containing protein n=1 Tax=Dictyobacter halimunensis TaxID=3026934 RepID=A0ABQ6FKM4_9CHLR|nr:hypothetical protein KDH_10540 [Dictyobacter sp. S3.2.2.5]